MDALSRSKWITASLFAQLMSCYPLFAYSISSRKGCLNQPIPAQPDTGKSWIFDNNCNFLGEGRRRCRQGKQHLFWYIRRVL